MNKKEYEKLLKRIRHKWHGTGLTKYWGPIEPSDARSRQEQIDAIDIQHFEKFYSPPLKETDFLVEEAAIWARNVFESYGLPDRGSYIEYTGKEGEWKVVDYEKVHEFRAKAYEDPDPDAQLNFLLKYHILRSEIEKLYGKDSLIWYANLILDQYASYIEDREELIVDFHGELHEAADPDAFREGTIRNLGHAAYCVAHHYTAALWKFQHEPAALEGYRHQEGRKLGQSIASNERKRIGKRSRVAVVQAVKLLYAENPDFIRNDQKTARKIKSQQLDSLVKPSGGYLGVSAIVKHIHAARKTGQL